MGKLVFSTQNVDCGSMMETHKVEMTAVAGGQNLNQTAITSTVVSDKGAIASLRTTDSMGVSEFTGKTSTTELVTNPAAVSASTPQDPPGTVTMDTADGRTLGITWMKNPATGTGIAVKSVDPGGQADLNGKIKEGM